MTLGALTELQLSLMKALWSLGEATVADVLEALRGQGLELAPTTVATLLQRLSKQGWVKHRKSGRIFLYRAKVEQRDAARGALQRLVSSFFGGSASALTAQLLDSEELSCETLAEMRRLIDDKRR